MSFKPRVKVHGEWATNGIAFATKEEAQLSASDLMSRWLLVEDCDVVESEQEPNYQIVDNELKMIGK